MSDKDILVVVSKFKNYIKSQYGLSTSGNVPEVLTGLIKKMCEHAVRNTQDDKRKTLMDRDFEGVDVSSGTSATM